MSTVKKTLPNLFEKTDEKSFKLQMHVFWEILKKYDKAFEELSKK